MRCSCKKLVLFVSLVAWVSVWKFHRGEQYYELVKYQVTSGDDEKWEGNKNCTTDTCLDLLPCSLHNDQLTVFIEPLIQVFDKGGKDITPSPSLEYLEIRSVIEHSRYKVDVIEDACLVMPGFDTLNINRFTNGKSSFRKVFNAGGRLSKHNILLFVFAGASILDFKAIVARTGLHLANFRRGFDVSLPLWNPYILTSSLIPTQQFANFMVVPIKSASHTVKTLLRNFFGKDCLVLDDCNVFMANFLCDIHGISYNVDETIKVCFSCAWSVKESEFTLIDDRVAGFEALLMSALRFGSIPVIISDFIVLPFSEVINWDLLSLMFSRSRLSSVLAILRVLSFERKQRLRKQITFIYDRYFSSLKKIVLTTLGILERRIVINSFTTYDDWNSNLSKNHLVSPFFFPFHAPSEGFTGVILANDKSGSLLTVMRLLAKVPSLRIIIVVWNHHSDPPSIDEWPHVNRPIRVIHMDRYLLSNRFIAFSEITTEAVFSLDQYVTDLSVDEVEFGYQAWRENPDRVVGFFSRMGVFNDSAKIYKYNVEWFDLVDVILMKASFYHKFYGMLYHDLMPSEVISYVESNKICEDIAMNFLISIMTGKSPLKVSSLKDFICPGM
ncbi:unnamed protein product [Thelazia callipaeda]|uniref:Exostosin domain-containing protein n=1 Tax=Thelazia callipaeda TaxID=103827 RepID=A0A0N5CJI8_THECL|nr:unnamed protein product [Thelazia callipaeda]